MTPDHNFIRRGAIAACVFALGAFSPAAATHDEASRQAAAAAAAAQNAAAQAALTPRQHQALEDLSAAFHITAAQRAAMEEMIAAFTEDAAQAADLQTLFGMQTAVQNAGAQLAAPVQGAAQLAQAAVQSAMAAAAAPELFEKADDPALGQGETVVAEFFDYQCGYCKRMFPAVIKAMNASNVRVVVKEFPILGANSQLAAEYALAADRQGKYAEFHGKLMTAPGRLSPESLDAAAAEVGLDLAQLKVDAKSPEVQAIIARNRQLAQALQITGTPAFFVGETPLRGAVGEEQFMQLVAAEKAKLAAKTGARTEAQSVAQ